MKRLALIATLALILILVTVAGASAHGKGNQPHTLMASGWHCQNVPGLGVHCFPPGSMASDTSIPVKVFDTDDPDDDDAHYLGTELLLRVDVYERGEAPCPQEGLEHWFDLRTTPDPMPYYACHHYSH
jgi:hypothetical protein